MRQCDNEAVRWCEKHAKSGLERRGKKRRQGNYFGGFGSQRLVAWLRGCRDEPVDVKFSAFGSPQLKTTFCYHFPNRSTLHGKSATACARRGVDKASPVLFDPFARLSPLDLGLFRITNSEL